MQVTITAAGIGALCGALTLLAGALLFSVQAIVRDEIRKLNGTYVRTELYREREEDTQRRLSWLESRVQASRAARGD